MIQKSLQLLNMIGLLFWASSTIAIEQSTAKTLSSSPITTGVLLETLSGLVLVLLIIALIAWFLRKYGQFQSSSNNDIYIISNLALGSRERAVLLQVADQQILVGVTTQQINTLYILDKNIETENKIKASPHFAERLQQMMQQRGGS